MAKACKDDQDQPLTLHLDKAQFANVERLVAYEVGNALLLLNFELQRAFGLRAQEHQIFMVIVFATVQRYMRSGAVDERFLGNMPLPSDHRGSISRRRICDALDIPLETVRRTVARLLALGMIEEKARGQLSTKGGTLQGLSEHGISERVCAHFLRVTNYMLEVGAAKPGASKKA